MHRVSLNMIVRDEAATLPRALASCADLVDEIIVVDTGSTDATKAIAAAARDRHGRAAQVLDFTWCDDFAAARNAALSASSGEWIFWMDADDWLDEPNRQALAALFAELTEENVLYQLWHVSPAAADGGHPASAARQDRLFRNLPMVRWRGRVHEQIVPAVLRAGGSVRPTNITIHHTGYETDAVRWQKVARNLRLLRLENAERPNDAYTLFYLGMTCGIAGRPDEAIDHLEHSLRLLPPKSRYLARLYLVLADCWRLTGNVERALAVCREALLTCPGDAELTQFEGELRLTGAVAPDDPAGHHPGVPSADAPPL
jgi:O-antigen biosynthesis protein